MTSLAAALSEDNRAAARYTRFEAAFIGRADRMQGAESVAYGQTMARYGLLDLMRDKGEVRPTVRATEFTVLLA